MNVMGSRKRDPNNPLVMKTFMAPAQLLARLQKLSDSEGTSESEIIRTALSLYLDRTPRREERTSTE